MKNDDTPSCSPATFAANLQGRFTRYYQHFLAGPGTPLGAATVLVGEYDDAD
ncbi:MAG: hypothetical protein AAF517_26580 [Planctomycetota bacterium]